MMRSRRDVRPPAGAGQQSPPTARLIAGAAPPPDPYDADVIILALDRIEETLAAIASARGQLGASVHVSILDQGSTPEALARLAIVIKDQPDVGLFSTGQNLGVAAGRNVLSALGHGRAIVALDNDAEFPATGTVARLVAGLDAEPCLAAIGCRIVRYDNGADDLSSWGYPGPLLPAAGESFDAVTFVGAGHAIRRAAWEQAGGYDPKLFFCWEEFDFCLRAIALGWRIRYRGDIAIRHKVSAEHRVGWTNRRWFFFVRNRLYIERKLDRGWIGMLPRIVGYLLKGARNGLFVHTLAAVNAAFHMDPGATRRLPVSGEFYLSRNDRAHRGSLVRRVRDEILARIFPATTDR